MAFKSDAHRRWWFANRDTGTNSGSSGDAGSSGFRERVKSFRAARESGMGVSDSFVAARSAEAEAAFNSQGGADWVAVSPNLNGWDLKPVDELDAQIQAEDARLNLKYGFTNPALVAARQSEKDAFSDDILYSDRSSWSAAQWSAYEAGKSGDPFASKSNYSAAEWTAFEMGKRGE